nr:hypothetical protein [Actinophytocola gossypii]
MGSIVMPIRSAWPRSSTARVVVPPSGSRPAERTAPSPIFQAW